MEKLPYGMVYKGSHADNGAIVSVKQIEKEMIEKDKLPMILKEADLLVTLNHVNLNKLIETKDEKKSIYFIFEYVFNLLEKKDLILTFYRNVPRGSLQRLVQTYGNFPESLCAFFVGQTLEVLGYLQSKGIRNNNVRCSNLLISNLGVVKLSGFGTMKADDLTKECCNQIESYWSISFFLLSSFSHFLYFFACTNFFSGSRVIGQHFS